MIYRIIALICMVFFLSSCGAQSDQLEQTEMPTTSSATDATIDTQPTEPPVDLSWLVDVEEALSYEDYFAEERLFTGTTGLTWTSWAVPQSGKFYEVQTDEQGLFICEYGADTPIYRVPNSMKMRDCNLRLSDGRYVIYIRNNQELYRLDLLTGDEELLFTGAYVFDTVWLGEREVLYFASEVDECIGVYRIYLPTRTTDLLYGQIPTQMPYDWFELNLPDSNLSPVTWTTMNPAFYSLLQEALRDEDSPYRINKHGGDMSRCWTAENIDNPPRYDSAMLWVCRTIQDDTGVRPFLMGIYDCKNCEYIEKYGVIDDCFFGTAEDHDHYS